NITPSERRGAADHGIIGHDVSTLSSSQAGARRHKDRSALIPPIIETVAINQRAAGANGKSTVGRSISGDISGDADRADTGLDRDTPFVTEKRWRGHGEDIACDFGAMNLICCHHEIDVCERTAVDYSAVNN